MTSQPSKRGAKLSKLFRFWGVFVVVAVVVCVGVVCVGGVWLSGRSSAACTGLVDRDVSSWQEADRLAEDAAGFFTDDAVDQAEVQAFVTTYGSLFSNHYFANALTSHVTIDELVTTLQHTKASWTCSSELDAGIGTIITLATGGTNTADPALTAWQHDHDTITINDQPLTDHQAHTAEQVRTVGTTVYLKGKPYASLTDAEDHQSIIPWTKGTPTYGYEWIGSALTAAATTNPSLQLGPIFLTGTTYTTTDATTIPGPNEPISPTLDSTATHLLLWDHTTLQTTRQAYDPGHFLTDPTTGDPIYALLNLLDQPATPPHTTNTTAATQTIADNTAATRHFLASYTLITITHPNRTHPATKQLRTIEYLVAHRYTPGSTTNPTPGLIDALPTTTPDHIIAYPDHGNQLGLIITQTTRNTHAPDSYTIIRDYLQAYCDGLAHNYGPTITIGPGKNQTPYGYTNRNLRTHTGNILHPYASHIADMMSDDSGGSDRYTYRESEQGFVLVPTTTLKRQLIGHTNEYPGFFTDLAYDTNTTNGRTPSLQHFTQATNTAYRTDLYRAMTQGQSGAVTSTTAQYAPLFVTLEYATTGSITAPDLSELNSRMSTLNAAAYAEWANTQPELLADAQASDASFIQDGKIVDYNNMDEQQINDYHAWFNNAPFPGDANDSARSLYSQVQQRVYIENRRIADDLGISDRGTGAPWLLRARPLLLVLLAGLAVAGVMWVTVRVTRSLSSTEKADNEPHAATDSAPRDTAGDAKEEAVRAAAE